VKKKRKVAKKRKKVTKKKKKVTKKKKKAPKKKKKAKKKAKRKGGKKAFGGYTVCFRNTKTSLEKVFGTRPIAPSMMTKKLWAYVKRHRLNKNG